MVRDSIQTYALTGPTDIISLSIAASQRCVIYASGDLRIAYDEAQLADGLNHFYLNFTSAGDQLLPFVIPPQTGMTEQRALYIRTETGAANLYVWLQG